MRDVEDVFVIFLTSYAFFYFSNVLLYHDISSISPHKDILGISKVLALESELLSLEFSFTTNPMGMILGMLFNFIVLYFSYL